MIMGERVIPRFCLSTADSPPFFPPHFFHQAALVDLGGHAGHASHITMSHGPRWCFVSRKVDSKKQFQIPTGYTVHICTSHHWVVFIGTHLKETRQKWVHLPLLFRCVFFQHLKSHRWESAFGSSVTGGLEPHWVLHDSHESYGIRHPLELRKSPHVSFFTLEPK